MSVPYSSWRMRACCRSSPALPVRLSAQACAQGSSLFLPCPGVSILVDFVSPVGIKTLDGRSLVCVTHCSGRPWSQHEDCLLRAGCPCAWPGTWPSGCSSLTHRRLPLLHSSRRVSIGIGFSHLISTEVTPPDSHGSEMRRSFSVSHGALLLFGHFSPLAWHLCKQHSLPQESEGNESTVGNQEPFLN